MNKLKAKKIKRKLKKFQERLIREEQERLRREEQERLIREEQEKFKREEIKKDVGNLGGIIEAKGFTLKIPKEAVTINKEFTIKQIHSSLKNEKSTNLYPSYHIEPSNITFNDMIDLEFDIINPNKKIALYYENVNNSLTLINPKKINETKVIFEMRSLGNVYLTENHYSINENINETSNSKEIHPGTNLEYVCKNPSCQKNTMIKNKFFKNNITKEKVYCDICKIETFFTNLVFYKCEGMITINNENINVSAIGERLIILTNIKFENIFAKMNKQKFNPKNHLELNKQNINDSKFDLGIDGTFGDIKLIIGMFVNHGITIHSFNHVAEELNKKGFKWKFTHDESEFLKCLDDYDVAWVVSYTDYPLKNSNFAEKIEEFHKKGKGLMLWEDDNSSFTHTNQCLKRLFNFTVGGNDPGNKVMQMAADCTQNNTFSKSHPITTGILELFEGVTICHPLSPLPPNVKVLATSSAGHPNIMYVEETEFNGRVVIDCGFTKLLQSFWSTEGTARYVRNATCWLNGSSYDSTL